MRSSRLLLAALGACLGGAPAWATDVHALGAAGAPLADVAVWATAKDVKKTPRDKARKVEVGQRDRAFEQLVSVVEVGKKASFPNHDVVRHHVYSFSAAKTFDLKLYAGGESPEVDFEQEGLVVLGCNIHDKMLAYVRVVPSGIYAVTGADGMAKLDLPEGEWVIHAWHPVMGEKSLGLEVASKGGSSKVSIDVLKK
jgi:plastocyanin